MMKNDHRVKLTPKEEEEIAKKKALDAEIAKKKHLENVVLDLSLSSAMPVDIRGTNLVQASASANSLACVTAHMAPKELRELNYLVKPLLILLTIDLSHPASAKAALCLSTLVKSRMCITSFVDDNGITITSNIFNAILSQGRTVNLKDPSVQRSVAEYLSIVYREVAKYYPWEVVQVGCLRHNVLLLLYGDSRLQTSACSTLAILSKDLEICKQMFTNGAIKPLLLCTDPNTANEAMLLAGLGCIVQMCKIPEIGVRVVRQGALPVLEVALHFKKGHSVKLIREKALYALAWLTRIRQDEVGGMPDLGTPEVLRGLRRELGSGTLSARMTVVQMLLNLHNKYASEKDFLRSVRDIIMDLLARGPWRTRNLCIKAVVVLYKDDDDKVYFAENGVIESIFEVIKAKSLDLQEAPLVAFLYFFAHPDIPPLFLDIGGAEVCAYMLTSQSEVIRELAVVCLKALTLYDPHLYANTVPEHLTYLLSTGDSDPRRYGAEYGDMIEDYMQRIVENRRDQHYLLELFHSEEEVEAMGITPELLVSYQNTFMELDLNCSGILHMDELKMLMVMMGEELDIDELQELMEKYGSKGTGGMNFRQFVIMMEGWSTQFGTGMQKTVNEALQRGAIGRARREFGKWWHQAETDKAELKALKDKRKAEADRIREMAEQHFEHEKIATERDNQLMLRLAKQQEKERLLLEGVQEEDEFD